jgi:hypothetical protein
MMINEIVEERQTQSDQPAGRKDDDIGLWRLGGHELLEGYC